MDKENIGYAVGFVADLGNGRQVSVSFNMKTGASKEEISTQFDLIRSELDRQQAKSALSGLRDDLAQRELQLEQANKDFERLEGRLGAGKGTLQERQQREAAIVNLEALGARLQLQKGILARLEKEAE